MNSMTKKKKLKLKTTSLNIILAIVSLVLIVISFRIEGERRSLELVYPREYSEYVEKYALEYHIDKNLVYAIIHQESKFNPNAVSRANARGLMQITEDTFEWLKMRLNDSGTVYDDLFDPETNIKYGTYFLSLLKKEFSEVSTQLAGYNAGLNITKTWLSNKDYSKNGELLDVIPYPETQNYVKIVMYNYKMYKKIY